MDRLERDSGDPFVFVYTDEQAVDDGVLVALDNILSTEDLPRTASGLVVNRATAALYEAFAVPEPEMYAVNAVAGRFESAYDSSPVFEAIKEVLKQGNQEDGWYFGNYRGRDVWIVPNEIGGATAMFPEDY